MTCQEFLARHAEYRDDLLAESEVARWEAHLSACPSCARYDRVIRQGVELLRSAPPIQPSSDFFPRLQHRIYHLDDELRAGARGPGASAMVSLAIAGVLALLAWSPLLRIDQLFLPESGIEGEITASGATDPTTDHSNTPAPDPLAAPALTGSLSGGDGFRQPRIDFSGPSALRPVDADWPTLYPNGRMRGWEVPESFGEFNNSADPLQVGTTPLPPQESWWWYGANAVPLGVAPVSGLALPRPIPYPPIQYDARAQRPAGARLYHATDSVPTEH